MHAAHTPVFKLLGHFEAFRPQGQHIAPMGVKSTLQRQISPQHGFVARTFLL